MASLIDDTRPDSRRSANGPDRPLVRIDPTPVQLRPGPGRFKVLIAGAGPAGIEAALAIQRIAGERIATTLLAPEESFVHLPTAVLSPFAAGVTEHLPLARLARSAGATLHRGALAAVDPVAREVRTSDGETLGYDALLVAVGGVQQRPTSRALAYGSSGSEEQMHGLIQDVEAGYIRRIAFVVPPGTSWPLPLYELALMMAERAFDLCLELELTLVTPEPSPVAVFGPTVSADVAQMLTTAGIALRSAAVAELTTSNTLALWPSGERLTVDRVATLPLLGGPAIDGLPHDADGFLPVDAHGRVIGAPAVFAAGDVTDYPIKQGGLACQQADAAAETIALGAGVAIEPQPFNPVLRGILLTERDSRWLQRDLGGLGADPGAGARSPLWSPPTKIVGRELSWHLHRLQVH